MLNLQQVRATFVVILGLLGSTAMTCFGQGFSLPENELNFINFTDHLNTFQARQAKGQIINVAKKDFSIMLPQAKEHDSPLFCRLEDKINQGNNIQCLFRLGSASYVNYLEQKGDHQRLLLEQLQ